jgi:PIN domain nuclease of toxin-antitoxin system
VESALTTILLDSHVLHYASASPRLLSNAARSQIQDADEIAVASITWLELAWLATHGRITIDIPLRP